jgi:MarR family transcriptional regulator, multiple antibiotic resistance protein MarR
MASTSSSSEPAADLGVLFGDLVRCETRLYNGLNDWLRERHGIVTSQYEFLRYPGSRVADIAAEFAIGIGATSKGADRLERGGWIARQPNPEDRRSSLLVLTEEGVRLIDAATQTFTERVTELFGGALDASQISAAAQAFSLLRSALERDQIGTPTG